MLDDILAWLLHAVFVDCCSVSTVCIEVGKILNSGRLCHAHANTILYLFHLLLKTNTDCDKLFDGILHLGNIQVCAAMLGWM
eukprot:gene2357-5316_t